MKKRLLTLFLAVLMAVGLCMPASAEATTEIYWFSTVTGFGPANWNVDDSPGLQYIRDEIGLTFNLEQPPTDAATKLGLMIATNDLPDLMSVASADITQQLIDSGMVWSMEEFLAEYAPDSWLLTDFPADAKQALIDQYGGWYTLPSHLETKDNRTLYPPNDPVWVDVAEKGSNMCIMFNKEIMEALDITEEMVSTESGFYEACEIVKNAGYEVDGQSAIPVMFHCNLWIGSTLDSILSYNFGALPVDEEGNYRRLEQHPAYKNALKFMNTCLREGYTDVNFLTLDETAMGSYLSAKRVFCWIGNQAQQDKLNMPWVSFGPVLADNGATPVLPVNKSAGTGWIQTLVSKNAKEPEKLAEMLSWSFSREGALVHYYGIEGEDYTIDSAGVVTRTEAGDQRLVDDYRSNVLLWPFANTSFERNTEPLPDPNSNRGVEIQLMPALGTYESTYIYDSSLINFQDTLIDPSSDLGIQYSQVKSYLESQKAKIVTAATDEDFEAEYNNMLTALDSYNIDGINAAYDEVYKQNCENIGDSIVDPNAELYK